VVLAVAAVEVRGVARQAVLEIPRLYPHRKEIMVEVLLTNVPLPVVVAQVQ
jgi:hypothetical protein